MILENQSQSDTSHSFNSPSKDVFNGNFINSDERSQFSRMKSEYHSKIRIRQLQKIKAQKRKLQQTNSAIQQILHSDFPKESDDARNWALNLVSLFNTSKKYQTDPYKLREIFLLAQKFPSLGTLRLFYLAIINTNKENIRTLFDLDVWRFLHNILQFPAVKSQEQHSIAGSDQASFSPDSKSLNIKFVQIEVIKAAIQTFVALFKKDVAFRDYSIGRHQTFSNYLRPAFRKYGDSIKTEMIYFLKASFKQSPKQYSKEYLNISKLTINMLIQYKQKFTLFFTKSQWDDQQTGETIQEVIKRAGNLSGIMYKLFENIQTKWLYDFVDGATMSKNYTYLDVILIYLNFGQSILNQLFKKGITSYYQMFQNAIDFMHNTFLFYAGFIDKTVIDGPQNTHLVPEIMRKIVWTLNFIQKCQQSKMFSECKRQLLLDIQKVKQLSLFTVDNALNSEFDNYNKFAKDFIFIKGQDGQQINLLIILHYLLNTVHNEKVLSQLINVIFSLLKMKIQQQEVSQFIVLNQMMEMVCSMLEDKLIVQNLKLNICQQFYKLYGENHENNLFLQRIQDAFNKSYSKIDAFIYSQMCSAYLFGKIQKVIKLVKNDQSNPNEHTVLI